MIARSGDGEQGARHKYTASTFPQPCSPRSVAQESRRAARGKCLYGSGWGWSDGCKKPWSAINGSLFTGVAQHSAKAQGKVRRAARAW